MSECEDFVIDIEPLPWSIPKEFDKGLEGDPYYHVADIPSKGFNKVSLMDVYRVKNEDRYWYVLRIFSEYGTEVRPRAVVILSPKDAQLEILRFDIRITCENIRGKTEAMLMFKREGNDYAVYFNGVKKFVLSDITNNLGVDSCAKYAVEKRCREQP